MQLGSKINVFLVLHTIYFHLGVENEFAGSKKMHFSTR